MDSVESAVAAYRGGADRLELCGSLVIGGTTPELSLYRMVRKHTDLPVRVLIRPRGGDFCYSDEEFEVLLDAVKLFREEGADAVVVGCLTPEGDVDLEKMKMICEQAGDLDMTFHRAFDMARDPEKALLDMKKLGKISTVLTSGQAPDAMSGRDLLRKLIALAGENLVIMPGSGISAKNIGTLARELRASVFHMSGKTALDSRMVYRNPNVAMGTDDSSEYLIWRTDESEVRAAREILDRADSGRS